MLSCVNLLYAVEIGVVKPVVERGKRRRDAMW